ncbi:MAG: hypothetical protein NWP98_03650 [Erythrobacter sp.]|nr:hypothetical protein [Erythrobacter sp.]
MLITAPLTAREVVDASPPTDLSVTIYRNPDRDPDEPLERDFPQGFALISETRRVTLPQGESTIRFEGVAEGMVGVSAIVTGLPGGTIEKNRNAQLLSPAALVNGTLGNRVTITRTNPATGAAVSEQAIVRTRADGGLVLQSSQGFEAVRCAGLPETLTFDRVPKGLSAAPVYSVDTRSPKGGTYDVTLTYLSWGFDWQANYVGTVGRKNAGAKAGGGEEFDLQLLSWLTLLNDNGQSFDNARLQIIAGTLNVDSDYEGLSDPPTAEPLRLECYPIGSTSAGSPVPDYRPQPVFAPPSPMAMVERSAEMIVVTGSRIAADEFEAPVAVTTAEEEDLGDLKLFRVPDRVDVSAKGMKQVAFLNKDAVKARYLYEAGCDPREWIDDEDEEPQPASMLLVTKNETAKGLGIALPQGALNLFEPTERGAQLAATTTLRDYARGQDVELEIGESAQVFARCARIDEDRHPRDSGRKWTKMRAELTNANPHPVTLRLQLGWSSQWEARVPRESVVVKNGYKVAVVTIPANQTRTFDWRLRDVDAE